MLDALLFRIISERKHNEQGRCKTGKTGERICVAIKVKKTNPRKTSAEVRRAVKEESQKVWREKAPHGYLSTGK